ncbi:hypothetical protein FB451DRAFT_1164175 [Mycena latifolia]|nr:hypothetical protein FB451DRAFT_1164175 [Mycena latifolia]
MGTPPKLDIFPESVQSCTHSFARNLTQTPPASAIPLLPNRRTFSLEQDIDSHLWTSAILRALCVTLHLLLVILHLMLLAICVPHLEHATVFPVDQQSIIAPSLSGITTTFASVYTAVLVLISQTLAMRRNIRIQQTLTATHDNSAAWSGIGAALLRLWNQRRIHASVFGTLSVLLYLANIAVIHISTPSLVSLQTFNSSQATEVKTQGLPEYTRSTPTTDSRTMEYVLPSIYEYQTLINLGLASKLMDRYVNSVLTTLLNHIATSGKQGVLNGTLYDVLDPGYSGEETTVAATGFNISCGYLPSPNTSWNSTTNLWQFIFPEPFGTVELESQRKLIHRVATGLKVNVITAPHIIGLYDGGPSRNSVTMFSTEIPILDTALHTVPWVNIEPPMTMPVMLGMKNVTALQFFQCSQALVKQTATVEVQSREAVAVEPDIEKYVSTWLPYSGPSPGNFNGSTVDMRRSGPGG